MPRHAQVNNIDHRDLKIDTRRSASLGDDVGFAATFPAEFRELQACRKTLVQRNANPQMIAERALLALQGALR